MMLSYTLIEEFPTVLKGIMIRQYKTIVMQLSLNPIMSRHIAIVEKRGYTSKNGKKPEQT